METKTHHIVDNNNTKVGYITPGLFGNICIWLYDEAGEGQLQREVHSFKFYCTELALDYKLVPYAESTSEFVECVVVSAPDDEALPAFRQTITDYIDACVLEFGQIDKTQAIFYDLTPNVLNQITLSQPVVTHATNCKFVAATPTSLWGSYFELNLQLRITRTEYDLLSTTYPFKWLETKLGSVPGVFSWEFRIDSTSEFTVIVKGK